MEKQKVLLSFVEKAPAASKSAPRKHEILALTADGKRLVRLQPEAPISVKQSKCQLIGVLMEKNNYEETSSRRQIRIESKSEIAPRQQLEANDENSVLTSGKSEDETDGRNSGGAKLKIPRPANAFMLFANEWRKKLAVENPKESNKDISVRLGVRWKTMPKELKEKYFALAREVDAEHKRKYPDYVYNPKEARLRKAMREQNRTQQPPAVNGPVSSGPTGTSNGQHQQTVSPLPGGGSSTIAAANRIIGPWFPLGHTNSSPPATHPKPILSPRVMAAHQRTLDKTKDVIRKQLQDCVPSNGPFPTGPSAYPVNGAQESSSDYCGEFAAEGQQQKWHPYQNGVNAYHSRGALVSKMNSLHRSMQNAPPHSNPRAWGQFCNVAFPTSQSAMMQQQQQQQQQERSNRHMVFLQEQQQQQQQSHCGYPTAEMRMSYESKMQDDLARRLHSSYSQDEQQLSRLPGSEEQKAEEPWTTTPRPTSSSSSCTPDGLLESESTPTTRASKQPLPGFQQAFGSTEIGRFSRSELFASLVEAVNVSSKSEELPSQFDNGRSSSPDYSGYNGSPLIPTKSLLKSRSAHPYRTSPDDPTSHRTKPPEFSARPSTQCAAVKSESLEAQEWPTAREIQPPPAHSQSHSFARPTEDDKREEHQQDDGLDLRVPWKKRKIKIEDTKRDD
ncbi:hypothetical protein TSAR_015815 [Trichomalopsis sarcophagae]|uniref:Sex-determining region Y protein n=1 Tax=Trichomalopsis sarcophagae TaxID=543379 RepID=A0A232F8B1_9HYME|nr:hypothetical protein TSAR_015815 [Trichomalopsis sarcophagae]